MGNIAQFYRIFFVTFDRDCPLLQAAFVLCGSCEVADLCQLIVYS